MCIYLTHQFVINFVTVSFLRVGNSLGWTIYKAQNCTSYMEVQSSQSANMVLIEHQLEQIVQLAPFLEMTDLIEEDISYLLDFVQKNPNYNHFENFDSRISQIFDQYSQDVSKVDQPRSFHAENPLPLLPKEFLAQVRFRAIEILKEPLPKTIVVEIVVPSDSRSTTYQNSIGAGNSSSNTSRTSSSSKYFSQNPNTFQT